MIVRFVHIGGIVDHHCLNSLFIIIRTSGNCFTYLKGAPRENISLSLVITVCLVLEKKNIFVLRNSYHRFMNCKLYLDRNQVYGSDEDKLLICCNL